MYQKMKINLIEVRNNVKIILLMLAICTLVISFISGIFIFEKKINEKTYPKTEEYKGYYLFETPNSQEYLEFISEFDYAEYEIVNVSGNYSTVGAEKELYMVTYKKIT